MRLCVIIFTYSCGVHFNVCTGLLGLRLPDAVDMRIGLCYFVIWTSIFEFNNQFAADLKTFTRNYNSVILYHLCISYSVSRCAVIRGLRSSPLHDEERICVMNRVHICKEEFVIMHVIQCIPAVLLTSPPGGCEHQLSGVSNHSCDEPRPPHQKRGMNWSSSGSGVSGRFTMPFDIELITTNAILRMHGGSAPRPDVHPRLPTPT